MRFALTGIQCLDESSEWSERDEPYLFLGMSVAGSVATRPEHQRTPVFQVDKGSVIHHFVPLSEGVPRDAVLAVVIREQDQGNPDAMAGEFTTVLQGAATLLGSHVGPAGSAVAGSPVALMILDEVGKGLSRVIGAGDDTVDQSTRLITRQEMEAFANKPNDPNPAVPVPADYSFDLGSDSQGIYRVFFNTTWI